MDFHTFLTELEALTHIPQDISDHAGEIAPLLSDEGLAALMTTLRQSDRMLELKDQEQAVIVEDLQIFVTNAERAFTRAARTETEKTDRAGDARSADSILSDL